MPPLFEGGGFYLLFRLNLGLLQYGLEHVRGNFVRGRSPHRDEEIEIGMHIFIMLFPFSLKSNHWIQASCTDAEIFILLFISGLLEALQM